MKNKLKKLSVVSFVFAVVLFIISFVMFHYITPDNQFSAVWQAEANKPFLTGLFAIWGVMHLFSSVMSILISVIFF
ncbi:MAG: hypothetical protein E7483_00370 [Ruminococcaceae bacterium]|nr:hypothetical protein [Oscillospiraceae bacterium]